MIPRQNAGFYMRRGTVTLLLSLLVGITSTVTAQQRGEAPGRRPPDTIVAPPGSSIRVEVNGKSTQVRVRKVPPPSITLITDLDLPTRPQLAAMHKETRLIRGEIGYTPERQALEAKWGPSAFAVVWLRIDGTDLPVQPNRKLQVLFEDNRIHWTGESRVNQQNPQSLDVQVLLEKDVIAGSKKLQLNGASGIWDYNTEPKAIRYVRMRRSGPESPESDLEVVHSLYVGEIFYVEVEYDDDPLSDTRRLVTRPGSEAVVAYNVQRVPDRRALFRSGPLLVDASVETAPSSIDALIQVPATGGVTLLTLEVETAAPSYGRLIGRALVLPPPPSLWTIALQKANACRASGESPTEISNRILVEGISRRSITISAEDHAAAILLRDELGGTLVRFADSELAALASDATTRQMHALYTTSVIKAIRDVTFRPPIAEMQVMTPDSSESIPLYAALTDTMEGKWFKGDHAKFFAYAEQEVARARQQLSYNAAVTARKVRQIPYCEVEELLKAVQSGLGPVVGNLQRKLMRERRDAEPLIPRWVPDAVARAHVAAVSVLAEAINDQQEYSSADTELVITAASGVAVGVGGLATRAGLGVAANVAGRIGLALDAVDLAILGNDFLEYGDALREIELAEGLVGIGGDSRLRAARENADNKKFALALNSMMIAGAGTASGLQGRRPHGKGEDIQGSANPKPADAAPISLPPQPPTSGNPLTKTERQTVRDNLRAMNVPDPEMAAMVPLARGLPADVAAAGAAMNRGVDPKLIMKVLKVNQDELVRLMDAYLEDVLGFQFKTAAQRRAETLRYLSSFEPQVVPLAPGRPSPGTKPPRVRAADHMAEVNNQLVQRKLKDIGVPEAPNATANPPASLLNPTNRIAGGNDIAAAGIAVERGVAPSQIMNGLKADRSELVDMIRIYLEQLRREPDAAARVALVEAYLRRLADGGKALPSTGSQSTLPPPSKPKTGNASPKPRPDKVDPNDTRPYDKKLSPPAPSAAAPAAVPQTQSFTENDVAFGLTRPKGEVGGLKNFAGKAEVGSGIRISDATGRLKPGPARNLAIAHDTVNFAKNKLQTTGGRLRFSLKGFDTRAALTPGTKIYNSTTSAELRAVLADPFLRERTVFYDAGGFDVTNEILRLAGPQ